MVVFNAYFAENIFYLYCINLIGMTKYIYQHNDWPDFKWDNRELFAILGNVRNLQGKLTGKMSSLGFSLKAEASLTTLTLDVLKSAEIEGEKFDYEMVRSSIARKLGIEYAGMVYTDRSIDGIVEMMLDATQNYNLPLDEERLFGWHAALFPTGRSGMYKIDVACYRTGEMQVVSGATGKEKVHYQAPGPKVLNKEMEAFLYWINEENRIDSVIKAAIAHLWFVTIHPFDDGNGRIARAIADMLLARSDESSQRFYSFSNQIMKERKVYYDVLEKIQHGTLDITLWLEWFLNCMQRAIENSEEVLQKVLRKAEFWKIHANTTLNGRQQQMLNKLLDGFDGKLKSSKWAKITKSSGDTALRDIKDLIEKGILKQEQSGGRSTNYELVNF
jgi:Fic family protein